MKIAFLTSEYPHPKINRSAGIGSSIFNLSKGLLELGHQVVVLVYGQDSDEHFSEHGILIYKIKNVKLKGFSLLLTQKKVARLINTLYLKKEIEIIEAVDWTGFPSFLKITCPLVIKLHGSDTYFCYLEGRKVKPLNRYLEKKALKNADGIIAVSKFTGDTTMKVFDLKKDFSVIANAIDTEYFKPNNSNVKENTLLYFGTLIRKKGVLELPDIFNRIVEKNKNVELVLVGKDAADIKTKSTSTWQIMASLFSPEALKKVQYLGPVAFEKMQSHISQSAVCVFPSFAEAFPVSWLEAMIMKKAVVSSNIGWANELMIHNVTGYTEHPKNHEAFSNYILEIFSNHTLRKTFENAAHKQVKTNFSTENIAKKTINYYSKIIDESTKF